MSRKIYGDYGYTSEKIIENHCHIRFEKSPDDTLKAYKSIVNYYNLEAASVSAIPAEYGITENYTAAYIKSKLNPIFFANAGIEYHFNSNDNSDYFTQQIKDYHAMGFDGIKMLEGKLSLYRLVKRLPYHPDYMGLFCYAEENEIPILMHVADPPSFWDATKASAYQIEKGWVYSPEEPSLEELHTNIDNLMSAFPKLKLTLAHFFFMSDNLPRLAKMFDTYPNLCVDLTPNACMYEDFSANIEEARLFFDKYSDRILYGTDTYNVFNTETNNCLGHDRVLLVRNALEKTEPYTSCFLGKNEKLLTPLALSQPVLSDIFKNNFRRIYGNSPRPFDTERILFALEKSKEKYTLKDWEKDSLETIKNHFLSLSGN